MIRSVFIRVTEGIVVSLPEMSEKQFNLYVLYVDSFVLQLYYFNVYY